MATQEKGSVPHIERTAAEPRDNVSDFMILFDWSQANINAGSPPRDVIADHPNKFHDPAFALDSR